MRYFENGKTKNLILVLAFVIFFSLGLLCAFLVDAFLGDVINIHYMSEIEGKEADISKIKDDAEFEEELIDLIDDCYSIAADYDLKTGAFYSELYHIDEEGISYEEGAKSNTLKGYLLDLKENHLKLYYDSISGYSVAPDMGYFIEKYGSRISEETNKYLEFRKDDMENGLYDKSLDSLSIDKAVEKIDFIDSYISTYGEEGRFYYAYSQLREYYMGVYDGSQHNFFTDNETNKLTPYAEKKYKEYAGRKDEIGEKAREILLLNEIQ